MTVFKACQEAAMLLIGREPGTIFAGTTPFALEMQALANEVAKDLAASHDWQALVRTYQIIPTGDTEYPLPVDYARMLLDSDIYDSTNWAWGYRHITRADEWLRMKIQNFTMVTPGAWTMQGDKFHFMPAPAAGSAATFVFITNELVKSATDEMKTEFTADTDEFMLPERLLKLGLIWKWRELKRLEASTDQANFEKAYSEAVSRDGGSKIIRKGPNPIRGDFRLAWPWPLGGV